VGDIGNQTCPLGGGGSLTAGKVRGDGCLVKKDIYSISWDPRRVNVRGKGGGVSVKKYGSFPKPKIAQYGTRHTEKLQKTVRLKSPLPIHKQ